MMSDVFSSCSFHFDEYILPILLTISGDTFCKALLSRITFRERPSLISYIHRKHVFD